MTRSSRFLSTTSSTVAQPPESVSVESDFVVILAALLCALICIVGLIMVARCACLRRRRSTTPNNSNRIPHQSSSANKGIKKKFIQTLPKFTFDSSKLASSDDFSQKRENLTDVNFNVNVDCAICLAEYVDGDEIRVLPQCGHGFHVGCIDTWLGSHSSCPSCREILVITRCRKCGEFPTIAAGEVSPVPAPEVNKGSPRVYEVDHRVEALEIPWRYVTPFENLSPGLFGKTAIEKKMIAYFNNLLTKNTRWRLYRDTFLKESTSRRDARLRDLPNETINIIRDVVDPYHFIVDRGRWVFVNQLTQSIDRVVPIRVKWA